MIRVITNHNPPLRPLRSGGLWFYISFTLGKKNQIT